MRYEHVVGNDHPGDCGCRAIAIAMNRKYDEVFASLQAFCKQDAFNRGNLANDRMFRKNYSSPTSGIFAFPLKRYLSQRKWFYVLCNDWGQVPKVGRFVVDLGDHVAAIVDETVHDAWDSRNQELFGFWKDCS